MSEIDVEGTALYYEDTGRGRPVLFLHGWGPAAGCGTRSAARSPTTGS
jgi:pimeloyl-ACP methyl ester carboxylesterase